MSARTLNTIGLILVLIGCVLLYNYGIPPPVDLSGKVYFTLEKEDAGELAKGERYIKRGRFGIALIGLGSLFQIWAAWVN
jgi:hypothetical protein